jgi:4-nitrophenyl phosphatase
MAIGWHLVTQAPNTSASPASSPCAVLCDLDGVVWLSHQPIAGSVDAIARLRAAGHRVLFVTNNSSPTLAEHEAALAAIGVPAHGDVISSAVAAARLLQPGERALVCANAGVFEALEARRVEAVRADTDDVSSMWFDAVVVGFHRWFDYDVMRRAAEAVRRGARLVATNHDPTYPTPQGPIPGGGSIVAAIAAASGVEAEVAGKPYTPIVDLTVAMLGRDGATSAVMVGDRPDTDGRFAVALGCAYAHVRSGVWPTGAPVDPAPQVELDDLAAVAAWIESGR